jgi:hypothetical protein
MTNLFHYSLAVIQATVVLLPTPKKFASPLN